MEKNIEVSLLFDFYGELLKPSGRQAVDLYYNEDLSLSEIADQTGITRQGVRDSIKRCEQQLYEFERKLGMLNRFNELERGLEQIAGDAARISQTAQGKIKELAERIQVTARALSADSGYKADIQ
ncbi:MAG: YlxM family DNA-binding protein [Ruminococcus sp.]|nr:YlxM family DNA-binding protein [Ruminococcus sp.]